MSNIHDLFSKEEVVTKTVEHHLADVQQCLIDKPNINMAFTVLIDCRTGMWDMDVFYVNMNNGDKFIAMEIMRDQIINAIRMKE